MKNPVIVIIPTCHSDQDIYSFNHSGRNLDPSYLFFSLTLTVIETNESVKYTLHTFSSFRRHSKFGIDGTQTPNQNPSNGDPGVKRVTSLDQQLSP